MTLITQTDELAAVCRRLAETEFVTVDTEFIRETTYWPQLCVAQLAGPDEAVAVDALAPGINLGPLFELLADPATLKVLHAGRQDVEIFLHLSGDVPTPMFDTQIAAMVCGFGESVGYETLVSKLAGANLDKHSRFTGWRGRPLTERQLRYAIDDVTHLRTVYTKLAAKLDASGRRAWLREDMATLANPATYVTEPEEAWQRLKVRSNDPRFLVLVRELAAWREREARTRDLARSRVLRDEALLAVAAHPPADRAQLARIRGVNKGTADSDAAPRLLEAVARAQAVPDSQLPPRPRTQRPTPGIGPTVALLRVLLKANSDAKGVAQPLVATSSDLERIAAGETEGVAALTGWRAEVFGNDALRLVSGDIALAARPGKGVVLVPIEDAAMPPRRAAV